MKRTVLIGLALVFALTATALAGDGWTHALGLYIWGVRANGTVLAGGDTHSIRMSGGDIIKSGNFGLGGHWEAYRSRWGFYLDGVYTQANYEYRQGGATVEPKLSLGLLDFGASYVLLGSPPARALRQEGPSEDIPISFDLSFGGRYTFLEAKADSTFDGGQASSAGGDAGFVDPVIGVRGNFPITGTVLFVFRGDVGGFTVASEFSSNFGMALHWAVAQKWWLNFVYRWYSVDYRTGSGADEIKYKMTHQGLLFGVTYVL
jgi:hypothetical protein